MAARSSIRLRWRSEHDAGCPSLGTLRSIEILLRRSQYDGSEVPHEDGGVAQATLPTWKAEEAERSRALVRARTTVGDFELTVCTDGTYLLDGGAMFGVVPKPLWQKRMPADDQNRILLGLNTAVVRTGKHTVVIETGIGNKQSPKMREINCNQELLPASLAAAGVRAEEVDIVINTHLHFDHCGWNTTLHAEWVGDCRRFRMRGTSRIAARWSMAICNWIGTRSAIFRRTMIRWCGRGR